MSEEMTKLERFKAMTVKSGLRCTYCHSQELLEVVEHEYEAGGAMLKFTYYCRSCDITVSGHVY